MLTRALIFPAERGLVVTGSLDEAAQGGDNIIVVRASRNETRGNSVGVEGSCPEPTIVAKAARPSSMVARSVRRRRFETSALVGN